MPTLVSERVGQLFLDTPAGRDRLEYTDYGAGDAWVVLLHGQLMMRRMHQPLARALAAEGLHVVTLDLLGHGRSDRPADPLAYSVGEFAHQVVALLDHLGAPTAVVGGTSLGANVSLQVAVDAPDRVRGLLLEMPVLNNAVEAGIMAFGPLMFAARYLPFTVRAARGLTRPVPRGLLPFWAGIVLDTLDQRPDAMAAVDARAVLRHGRADRPPASRDQRAGADRRTSGRPAAPRGGRRDAGRRAAARAVRACSKLPRVADGPRAARRRGGRVRPVVLGNAAPAPSYTFLKGAEWCGAALPRRGDRAAHPQAG